jgi:hypothetical protein
MLSFNKMFQIPHESKFMPHVVPAFSWENHLFVLSACIKCRGRKASPLGDKSPLCHNSPALHFTRYLISFSCRYLKNMSQNHSVVCSRFGALDRARRLFHDLTLSPSVQDTLPPVTGTV